MGLGLGSGLGLVLGFGFGVRVSGRIRVSDFISDMLAVTPAYLFITSVKQWDEQC